jgi:hypothetical protein
MFASSFNQNQLKERFDKKLFRGLKVLAMYVFSTKTIIVSRYNNKSNKMKDKLLELYFLNKKRRGVDNYVCARHSFCLP